MFSLQFIPFIHNTSEILYIFFILSRITGIFLIAPLLKNASIPTTVRALIIIFTSALLSMAMYSDYFGDSPKYVVRELADDKAIYILSLILISVKELIIGYLIGFAFTIIFEGIYFGGQMLNRTAGLALSQMFDPLTRTNQTLLVQFMAIFASLIILSLDLHHIFIKTAAYSFSIIPLGHFHLSQELLPEIVKGTARIFVYGISYSAFPYIIGILITISLGFIAKVMPEMNIFMFGFPLRILVSYYAIIIALGYVPLILQQAFVEYHNLAKLIIRHIGGG